MCVSLSLFFCWKKQESAASSPYKYTHFISQRWFKQSSAKDKKTNQILRERVQYQFNLKKREQEMVLKSSTQFGNVLPKTYRISIEKALKLSIEGLGREFLFLFLSFFFSKANGKIVHRERLNWIYFWNFTRAGASATAANNIDAVW